MEKFKKNFKHIKFNLNLLKKIIIGFVLINLMIFISVFADQCTGKVNRKAKLLMSSAATINIMYIFPIYKIFGWDSPIAKPFCIVRNRLYKEGLKNIPNNDGERELWWFIIRFTEYDRFVMPKLNKFFWSSIKINPTQKELNKYQAFTEELYKHIYPLGTLKIQDKNLRSRRYNMFIAVVSSYTYGKTLISYKKDELAGKKDSPYDNDQEIHTDKVLLDLILKQRDYTKKYERESWDYYRNKTVNYYSDDLALFGFSNLIVINKLRKKELTCDDKYLNIYGDTRRILRNYLSDTKLPVSARKSIDWSSTGIGQDDEAICKLCPNNKHLDLLITNVKHYAHDEENSKRYEEMRMVGKDRNYKPKNTTVIRLD
jgi:hypothetical protein